MNKFVIVISTAIFVLGSSFAMVSGNESSLPYMSAQDILNKMACEGKEVVKKSKTASTVKWLLALLKSKTQKNNKLY